MGQNTLDAKPPNNVQVGNGAPSARRRHLHQGGEGGIVERHAHGEAEKSPRHEVHAAGLGTRASSDKAYCNQHRAERHDGLTAVAVDKAANDGGR